MKKFLLFLFTPIIEFLSVPKKLKVAEYRVKQLKTSLKQLTDCLYSYSGNQFNGLKSFDNDTTRVHKKIYVIVLISCLLMVSLITVAFLYRIKIITIIASLSCILLFLIEDYLLKKILIDYNLKKLKQVKQDMQDLVNPNKCYERLGIDILQLQGSSNLLPLIDPDQRGQIIPLTATLRYKLTDKYGYIIPNIRFLDNPKLKDNEYTVLVRGFSVASGKVYSDKILINSKNIKDDTLSIEKVKFDGDYIEDSQNWYWVNKSDIDKFEDVEKIKPEEVIIKHLEKIVMEYVDYIFSIEHVMKMIALVDEQHLKLDEKRENWYVLYYYFKDNFDFGFVRKVLVTLLQKRISIKDIMFVLERTMEYSRTTKEPSEIALKIEHDINYLKNKKTE